MFAVQFYNSKGEEVFYIRGRYDLYKTLCEKMGLSKNTYNDPNTTVIISGNVLSEFFNHLNYYWDKYWEYPYHKIYSNEKCLLLRLD